MFIKADVRCGSRLCENSDVELARRKFVSITLNNKRTALAVTVERRKERKQVCAFSARARFHTTWTHSRHLTAMRSIRRVAEIGVTSPGTRNCHQVLFNCCVSGMVWRTDRKDDAWIQPFFRPPDWPR